MTTTSSPTPAVPPAATAYDRLIALLDEAGASYRLIDHEPEGRTELVSAMRGNDVAAAAKCIVVMVKLDKKTKRFVLAVVPGDRRVDLGAVKALLGGTYAGFATASVAEELAGSVSGTILPFSFHPDLELVVDPALLEHAEIYFNAARLDRSMALATADYRSLARPRTAAIAEPSPAV
ncbi:YbaK/EbsC family protein [Actinomadura fulvescens]|uniref:YbaK/EbsC family protein n=1 Tax=Actinomadura fulvescens TaxID=46160 RepID=UPI0031D66AE5